MQTIDRINTRLVLNEVQRIINETLAIEFQNKGELPDNYVRDTLTDILEVYVEKGAIASASVDDIYLKRLPWTALYLNKWERVKARFAHEILRLDSEREGKPNVLLRWLGYKEEVRHIFDRQLFESQLYDLPIDDIRSYIVDLVDEHLMTSSIRTETVSKLLVPHEVKVCNISILPSGSDQRIKISTTSD